VLYQLSYCGEPISALRNRLKTRAPDIGRRLILQGKRWRTRGVPSAQPASIGIETIPIWPGVDVFLFRKHRPETFGAVSSDLKIA
jgi:hypothetical protein